MSFFNAMVTAELKAYVYALADPNFSGNLAERIFYIGKGRGNRCFNHARIERGLGDAPLDEREHKLSTIREIHSQGKEVDVLIVSHGMTDQQALGLEAVLIPLLGEANKVSGHGNQLLWLTRNQVDERYDKPVERSSIDLLRGNIVFVSLNQQDVERLSQPGAEAELASSTLGDWNLAEHKSRLVDCVIGVKYGLVVSVYRTEKSDSNVTLFERYPGDKKRAHGRSRFQAVLASELTRDLRGRSVFDGEKMLSKIRPGAGCEFFSAMERG